MRRKHAAALRKIAELEHELSLEHDAEILAACVRCYRGRYGIPEPPPPPPPGQNPTISRQHV